MRESTMSPSIKPFAVIAALAIAVAITTFIFIFGFGTIEPGGDDLTKTESAPAIENADLASASRAAIDTPKRVVAKTERELRTQLQFDKSRAGICVTLKLVDTGEFIGGADVSLEDGREKPRASVIETNMTNDDGFLVFIVKPESPYRLHIQFPAKSDTQKMDVIIPPIIPGDVFVATVEVPRRPPHISFGRLLDATTRKPVAGAEIEYVRDLSPNASNLIVETVKSDSRGEFRLGVRELKDEAFRIHAKGYQTALIQFEPVAETRTQAVDYFLAPGAGLKIIVKRADAPVGNVKLTISVPSGVLDASLKRSLPRDKAVLWKGITDRHGIVVFSQLPPAGPFEIKVLGGGDFETSETLTIPLTAGKVTEHRIQLATGTFLWGTVVDQYGSAVVKCNVTIERNGNVRIHADTNTLGQFMFSNVPPGEYVVTAGKRGLMFSDAKGVAAIAARPIPVRVEPGAREMNITIRADRGLYISGKLVDERGASARREFIYCRGAPGNDWGGRQLYTVKADGTFRCGPLVSGEYLLSADRRNNATDIQDRDSVLAIAGTTDARVVVFANSRVLISLTNSAVESESVDLKLIMKEPLFGVDAQSRKATGSEETIFDALEPGRYAIVASTDSGMFAVEPFFDLGKNETKTCTLQLEPGGQVKVHFKKSKNLDDYGMLSVLKNDIPIVSHFNDGDESAKTIKVPAGSLRLESYGGGAEWTKEVFVTPGQAIYVEIP